LLSRAKIVSVSDKLKELGISEDEQEKWKFENAWRIIQVVSSDSIRNFVKNLEKIPAQDIGVGLSSEKKIFFYSTKSNLNAAGRIRITFADDFLSVHPCDFWQDIKTTGIAREGDVSLKFGKKPEKLLFKIIYMTTKTNDIVLDFFTGTGTTCAVAHKMGRQYIGVEQLEYGENSAVVRLKNVINGDKTGISKDVGWKGGGDFVYMELMKLNEAFVEKIQDAKTTEDLLNIWEDMKQNGFLSYRADPRLFDENIEEFKALSLDEQKKLLLEMLEYNDLYVNYSEIDDAIYNVSEEDKKLNKEFYEGNKNA